MAKLYAQMGKTADIWKASLAVRMDTGWKPILLYAVARRDGSAEGWFRHDLESSRDAQESNVA